MSALTRLSIWGKVLVGPFSEETMSNASSMLNKPNKSFSFIIIFI
jgi:hypothetical protein